MQNKKNPSIENIFISTADVIYESTKAIKLAVKTNESNTFVWISKKFIYPSKYENSMCIGVIKNNEYEIMQEDISTKQKSLYQKVTGHELLQIFKKTKEKQVIVNEEEFKQGIIPDWVEEWENRPINVNCFEEEVRDI